MENTNVKIGISSSIIIIVGCLFKMFHLQGAEEVLTLGFLIFSLVFMPFIIFSQIKERKIINGIAGIFVSALIIGVLFKIMFWPGANFLISWSVTISLFIITPIYILSNYFKTIDENFSKEDRMKKIIFGVFILTFLSLWYAMIDISSAPYSIP
ncbi:MAG: hypothetical protein P8I80_01860 [Bacteroidales bacterium]|nr:hypothetical protein [Bacteroidales bacterium]MDG2080732.1 hypothetical protein [Bacteroidales bacterium]